MGFEYHSLATGQFQMPDGWSLSTIQKVAEVNEKAITKRNAPSHIHYIDIASVDKGKLLDIQELPFEKAPSRARRVVRDKDSLIATVRPNLEHYMFVKEPRPNTIASTGFAVVTAKTADPRFLYYYLTSKPFTAYLTQIAESHTSAYPAFNSDVIEKAELVLPSDSEQRAISHVLGSLDDKIELNRRMNETLEATAGQSSNPGSWISIRCALKQKAATPACRMMWPRSFPTVSRTRSLGRFRRDGSLSQLVRLSNVLADQHQAPRILLLGWREEPLCDSQRYVISYESSNTGYVSPYHRRWG